MWQNYVNFKAKCVGNSKNVSEPVIAVIMTFSRSVDWYRSLLSYAALCKSNLTNLTWHKLIAFSVVKTPPIIFGKNPTQILHKYIPCHIAHITGHTRCKDPVLQNNWTTQLFQTNLIVDIFVSVRANKSPFANINQTWREMENMYIADEWPIFCVFQCSDSIPWM